MSSRDHNAIPRNHLKGLFISGRSKLNHCMRFPVDFFSDFFSHHRWPATANMELWFRDGFNALCMLVSILGSTNADDSWRWWHQLWAILVFYRQQVYTRLNFRLYKEVNDTFKSRIWCIMKPCNSIMEVSKKLCLDEEHRSIFTWVWGCDANCHANWSVVNTITQPAFEML